MTGRRELTEGGEARDGLRSSPDFSNGTWTGLRPDPDPMGTRTDLRSDPDAAPSALEIATSSVTQGSRMPLTLHFPGASVDLQQNSKERRDKGSRGVTLQATLATRSTARGVTSRGDELLALRDRLRGGARSYL